MPAAQATTKMYAPGGPTSKALHNHTATTATADTASTPNQGIWAGPVAEGDRTGQRDSDDGEQHGPIGVGPVAAVAGGEGADRGDQTGADITGRPADQNGHRSADGCAQSDGPPFAHLAIR
jgi:hypothetical protein